jgi:hypothetical protein
MLIKIQKLFLPLDVPLRFTHTHTVMCTRQVRLTQSIFRKQQLFLPERRRGEEACQNTHTHTLSYGFAAKLCSVLPSRLGHEIFKQLFIRILLLFSSSRERESGALSGTTRSLRAKRDAEWESERATLLRARRELFEEFGRNM